MGDFFPPMAEQPFISIVIPCKDSAQTIRECVESACAQEYPKDRYEIIVVDNGSSDGTAAIAAEFPVRVVREESIGRSQARNRGFLESRGEFVAFIDSDTVIPSSWLSEMLGGFINEGIGGVQSRLSRASMNSPFFQKYREWLDTLSRHGTLNSNAVPVPFIDTAACMYRAAVLRELDGPFDIELGRCEDVDLSFRAIIAGWGLGYPENAPARVFYDPTVAAYLKRAFWEGYFDRVGWMKWIPFIPSGPIKPFRHKALYKGYNNGTPGQRCFHFMYSLAGFFGWHYGRLAPKKISWKLPEWAPAKCRIRMGDMTGSAAARFIPYPTGVRIVVPKDRIFYFNDTASDILKMFIGGKSMHDVCSAVAHEYEVDTDTVRSDIDGLLRTLKFMGVVEE